MNVFREVSCGTLPSVLINSEWLSWMEYGLAGSLRNQGFHGILDNLFCRKERQAALFVVCGSFNASSLVCPNISNVRMGSPNHSLHLSLKSPRSERLCPERLNLLPKPSSKWEFDRLSNNLLLLHHMNLLRYERAQMFRRNWSKRKLLARFRQALEMVACK